MLAPLHPLELLLRACSTLLGHTSIALRHIETAKSLCSTQFNTQRSQTTTLEVLYLGYLHSGAPTALN